MFINMPTGIDAVFKEAKEQNVVSRLWARDYTLWKPDPKEISNRLGWIDIAQRISVGITELQAFAEEVRSDGYTQVVLIGMGGSSLAPEVFRKTFGVRKGFLDLTVADSTDPGAILDINNRLDFRRTLFIVSTKSGTTTETLSLYKYFFGRAAEMLGAPEAGRHFIAVTDPGSPLERSAPQHLNFRRVFHGDPNIGGRYSALSHFGLVPAALIGLDLNILLEKAISMMSDSQPSSDLAEGAKIGVIMGELARAGRDKLTIITSPGIAGFGDWLEQLIAESTGKEGQGILPVVGETIGSPDVYGDDRFFVSVSLAADQTNQSVLRALEAAGHPVIHVHIEDIYDLAGQFFLWEMATAVAGWRLKINPFDQPNVESSKVAARQMINEYLGKGMFPEEMPSIEDGGLSVYSAASSLTPEEAFLNFVDGSKAGNYIALQAYIQPTEETDCLLLDLRKRLRNRYRIATTTGYGPRFLHSTGQLHKGDAGRGLFIQFTADDVQDVAVTDEDLTPNLLTFGILKQAQAMGDRKALEKAGRRVIRFHLGADIRGGLKRLTYAVKQV